MSDTLDRVLASNAPAATVIIRVLVGLVFLSDGIQKFLFPDALGVGRFTKIGIPAPELFAPFVGFVEISCGLLLVLGLATRLAAIPLLINISVAIATTKLPMLVENAVLVRGARVADRLQHAARVALPAARRRRAVVARPPVAARTAHGIAVSWQRCLRCGEENR